MRASVSPRQRQGDRLWLQAGKLRVGLQLGSPHNVIRDSASGEMKGVGFDLGKELAAHKFIEDAKSEGLVKAAIERAGLRGVIVAPLK